MQARLKDDVSRAWCAHTSRGLARRQSESISCGGHCRAWGRTDLGFAPRTNNPDLETYGAGSMERDREKERENRMKEAEYMDVIKSSQ